MSHRFLAAWIWKMGWHYIPSSRFWTIDDSLAQGDPSQITWLFRRLVNGLCIQLVNWDFLARHFNASCGTNSSVITSLFLFPPKQNLISFQPCKFTSFSSSESLSYFSSSSPWRMPSRTWKCRSLGQWIFAFKCNEGRITGSHRSKPASTKSSEATRQVIKFPASRKKGVENMKHGLTNGASRNRDEFGELDKHSRWVENTFSRVLEITLITGITSTVRQMVRNTRKYKACVWVIRTIRSLSRISSKSGLRFLLLELGVDILRCTQRIAHRCQCGVGGKTSRDDAVPCNVKILEFKHFAIGISNVRFFVGPGRESK